MTATYSIRDAFQKSFAPFRDEKLAKALLHEQVQRGRPQTRQGAAFTTQGSIQQALRPLFEKGPTRLPTFGDHPDFAHLRGTTNTEKCAITTLFMDLEDSTRLGILYPPEAVYLIKNLFICAAIEIINAYDGHVHRIMGDAVMAYFGGTKTTPAQGAVDAVNCASVLRYYVESTVIPMLSADGFNDPPFGIRIGVDHGPAEKVLWSTYGYPGQEEVTATSFFVDVASKLQHSAPRNQIMIGQSIRTLLDLPEDLLQDKEIDVGGKKEADKILTPNYTDRNGNRLNYRKHILRWENYLRLTPLAPIDPERFMPGQQQAAAFSVSMSVHSKREGPFERATAPASSPIQKDKGILFTLQQRVPWMGECTVKFAVENNGAEADRVAGRGNHITATKLVATSAGTLTTNWEDTAYRGLHYMNLEVTNARSNVVFRRRLGVYVE
jgi:adenylate cyclase